MKGAEVYINITDIFIYGRNKFPKIRFHALRHTFVTMARSAGVPIEDLQDLLGHAEEYR